MRDGRKTGLLAVGTCGMLPKSGKAAVFAEAKDSLVESEEVGLDFGVVELFNSFAGAADEGDEAGFEFGGRERGKFRVPEMEIGVDEGDAIGEGAVRRAGLVDDADDGFAVAIGAAKDELLLGRKFVAGEDAGAVEAEDDGGGGLGENFAVQIAADEEDGDGCGDATSDAHNLLGHAGGLRKARAGTIQYQFEGREASLGKRGF